jgi:biopolymer transport protein ExbB
MVLSVVLSQATAKPVIEPVTSVWGFAVKGGFIMIPLGLLSVVALAIIIERVVLLRRSRVVPAAFLESVRAALPNRRRALELCRANATPAGAVLGAALRHLDDPQDRLERLVSEAGQREVLALKRRMRLLSAVPQTGVMLGLLGTVFGMIKTFQSVAASGEALGKAEMLARGIYEAWTATASGLIVAVPALIVYQWLLSKIDSRAADLDRLASEWAGPDGLLRRAPESRPQPAPEPASEVLAVAGAPA